VPSAQFSAICPARERGNLCNGGTRDAVRRHAAARRWWHRTCHKRLNAQKVLLGGAEDCQIASLEIARSRSFFSVSSVPSVVDAFFKI